MGLPTQTAQARSAGGTGADWRCLAVLALLALALRGWQLTHTEVASRDSIGYIRIAWELEHGPWREVMPRSLQHPGYPLALLAISGPVRHYCHADLATLMQYSAQLTSALASVLLVIPTFYLGKELFNRRIGLWGALFFQCLPASGRGMADGLSEPVFLLAASAALAFACNGLRRGSVVTMTLCGLCGGLAYFTRPEGALIVVLTGVVLVGLQFAPRWRRPWRRVLIQGAALSVAAAVIAVPFIITIGHLTTKHTSKSILSLPELKEPTSRAMPAASPPFAAWWPDLQSDPSTRIWWGALTLVEILARAFFYVLWVPAALGAWWFRDRLREAPGSWVLLLLSLVLTLLLYRVAQLLGYLSDRHCLLLLLCGSYFTVAALERIGRGLGALVLRLWPRLAGARWAQPQAWATATLVVCVAAPLPRTLERLHADRCGFRDAGYWLAENTLPGDYVLDPYCWANYYAGRVFTEGRTDLPAHNPPLYYLVVEESKNKHTRLAEHNAAEQLKKSASEIKRFEARRGKEQAFVVVYLMHGIPPLPVPASQQPPAP